MGQIYRFLGLTVGLVVPDDRRLRGQSGPPTPPTSPTAPTPSSASTTCATTWRSTRDQMVQRGLQLRDRRRGRLDPHRRGPHAAHHLRPVGRVDPALLPVRQRSPGRSSATRTTRSTRRSGPSSRPRTGIAKVERQLGVENLYDAVAVNYVHQLGKALEAKELYHRDKDYIVADGEVKIVDEFTGRVLEGRRWSDGLHQAVEAKERVRIHEENHTWATVTLQNYFRMYEKLAGMTGTAETEAAEFASTYGLEVVPIPTQPADGPRRPGRPHLQDRGRQVQRRRRRHRRALRDRASRSSSAPPRSRSPSTSRGCSTSRASRTPSSTRSTTPGRRRSSPRRVGCTRVTVATNMAGRGVDILLGGNPEGLAARTALAEGLDPDDRRGHGALDELARRSSSAQCAGRGRRGARARRALRPRLRAPREPAHRQPAAWPLRPPGRPRREPLLPLARGRADAAVRHRRDELGDGPSASRRRADRGADGDAGDREGAEHRRAEERRGPQGRPQVRRGDERAAQGDLRAPHAGHRRRGPARDDRRAARADDRPGDRADCCPSEFPEEWDLERLVAELAQYYPTQFTVADLAQADERRAARSRASSPRRSSTTRARRQLPGGAGDRPRARAPGHAADHRPALAPAPRRDGLPARGHPPARHRPDRPARRLAARGLRDVRPADGRRSTTTTCASSPTSQLVAGRGGTRPTLPGDLRGRRRPGRPTPSLGGGPIAAGARSGTGAAAPRRRSPAPAPPPRRRRPRRPSADGAGARPRPPNAKVGRNEPCWCGSGKKFKLCHGAN